MFSDVDCEEKWNGNSDVNVTTYDEEGDDDDDNEIVAENNHRSSGKGKLVSSHDLLTGEGSPSTPPTWIHYVEKKCKVTAKVLHSIHKAVESNDSVSVFWERYCQCVAAVFWSDDPRLHFSADKDLISPPPSRQHRRTGFASSYSDTPFQVSREQYTRTKCRGLIRRDVLNSLSQAEELCKAVTTLGETLLGVITHGVKGDASLLRLAQVDFDLHPPIAGGEIWRVEKALESVRYNCSCYVQAKKNLHIFHRFTDVVPLM
jgi:hypothetical protein